MSDGWQLSAPTSTCPTSGQTDKKKKKPAPSLAPTWNSNMQAQGHPVTTIKTRATCSHFLRSHRPLPPSLVSTLLSPESPTANIPQCFHTLSVHVWHLQSLPLICQLGWDPSAEGHNSKAVTLALVLGLKLLWVNLASSQEGKLKKKERRAETGWSPQGQMGAHVCLPLLPALVTRPSPWSLSSTHVAQGSEKLGKIPNRRRSCRRTARVSEVSQQISSVSTLL